jgi:hypothetical protein
MTFGVDYLALIVSVIVAVLTIREFRRNNNVCLKVVEVKCGGRMERNSELIHELTLTIRNVGIALHDVAVSLHFRPPGGAGWMTTHLKRVSLSKAPVGGEFAKGMIAVFKLSSETMTQIDRDFLRLIKDAIEQEACFVVSAQGYEAKAFKVGVGRDAIARRWNELGWRINPMFDTYVRPKGREQKYLKSGNVIRRVPSFYFPLTSFVREIGTLPPKPEVKPEPLFKASSPAA